MPFQSPFTLFTPTAKWPIIICLATILVSAAANAQNLVPNPGFEEYLDPPPYGAAGVNESVAWFLIDNTTDFFHRDFRAPYTVPSNFRGYQEPATGDGYAGIISWPLSRQEYLAVQLTQPLEAGKIYEVGFKVNLSNLSRYASDNLGLTFLRENPSQLDVPLQEAATYHFKNPDGELIVDTVGWKELRGSYLAEGGEQFLVIGNFRAEHRIRVELSNGNSELPDWAYFYIDDVYVQTCQDQIIEPLTTLDTLICEGASVELSGLPEAETYYWENLDVTQHLVVNTAGTFLVHNFFQCRDVQLVYEVETGDCSCSIQIPSIQGTGQGLHVIPSINVQSYRLVLFDASGRLLFSVADTDLERVQPPRHSVLYFWSADLTCLDVNDRPFRRRVGGKTLLMDR